MMEIQKKVIIHVFDELQKIEAYKVYSHVSSICDEFGVDDKVKQRLLKEMDKASKAYIEGNIEAVKGWLRSLLKDLED
jgi:hypothetical protein